MKKKKHPDLTDLFPQLKYLDGRDYTRELVRIRDGFTCVDCKKSWKKGERRFDVHHLDNNPGSTRKYDKVDNLKNLITLCHKCHLNRPESRKAISEGRIKAKKLSTGVDKVVLE